MISFNMLADCRLLGSCKEVVERAIVSHEQPWKTERRLLTGRCERMAGNLPGVRSNMVVKVNKRAHLACLDRKIAGNIRTRIIKIHEPWLVLLRVVSRHNPALSLRESLAKNRNTTVRLASAVSALQATIVRTKRTLFRCGHRARKPVRRTTRRRQALVLARVRRTILRQLGLGLAFRQLDGENDGEGYGGVEAYKEPKKRRWSLSGGKKWIGDGGIPDR